MADRKQGGEPALEFSWDPLELAADQTYSTTLRIKLTGWWEGDRPREVSVRVYQKGEEPPSGKPMRIQKGYGTFPLTGLEPGHHYLVDAFIGDRAPVQKMIPVPDLPKPKRLTSDEKKTVALKARLERVKAEQELKEAERKLARELKRTRFSESMAAVDMAVKPEPAKEEKKQEKVPRPPLSQRIREAYTQERNKGKPPVFEFKIQRRRPLIFLSDSPQGGQDGE